MLARALPVALIATFAIAASAVPVAATPAGAADGALPRISGTVVDDAGSAQGGASIYLHGASSGSASTSDDGHFSFQVDRAGEPGWTSSFALTTRTDHAQPATVTVGGQIPIHEDVDLGDLSVPTLLPWQVRVVDAQGDPARGATLGGSMVLPTRALSSTIRTEASVHYSARSSSVSWDGSSALALPPVEDWVPGVKAQVTSPAGTRYQYDIVNGEIDRQTKTVTVTTREVDFPPAAAFTLPTNVTGAPVGGPGYHRHTMSVTWDPAAHPDVAIDSHLVQIDPGGAVEASFDGDRAVISSVAMVPGRSYRFRVSAQTAEGGSPWSAWSAPVVASDVPPTPAAPRLTTIRDKRATVEWDPVTSGPYYPLTGYRVSNRWGTCPCQTVGPEATSTTIPVQAGDNASFRVQALSQVGLSALSPASDVMVAYSPPFAPTRVRAAPSNGAVDVTWQPVDQTFAWYAADPETYTVRLEPGGHVVQVAAPSTHARVTGLANGTTYEATVVANSAYGDSQQAGPVSVRAGGPPGVVAEPVALAGNRQALVTWAAPVDNGSPMAGYRVTSSPDGIVTTVPADSTSATITGLTNGTTYTFTVVAINTAGFAHPSAPSNQVTPGAAPDRVAQPIAVSGDRQATVSWLPTAENGFPVSGYTVTATPGGRTTAVSGGTTRAVVTGLTNGTPYTFTVVAANAAGDSVPSAASNVVRPAGVPSPVSRPSVHGGDRAAVVSWAAAADNGSPVTGYTITSSPAGVTRSVGGDVTTTAVDGLTNGIAYTFTVVATNAAGASDPSQHSLAVVPAGAPPRMAAPRAKLSARALKLSWPEGEANGSPITRYVVVNDQGFRRSLSASARKVIVKRPRPGVYRFSIMAVNAVGSSTPSPTVRVGVR